MTFLQTHFFSGLCVAIFSLLSTCLQAADVKILTAEELKAKIVAITEAQNKFMMEGSTKADIENLFSYYTDDFTYLHDVYGGTYTRAELFANSVRNLEAGRYKQTTPRYTIITMIPGYNGIAVERQETYKGETRNHLAVFEFRADKVSKIIEYWK